MPQATLMNYLRPIQPNPGQPLPKWDAHAQSRLSHSSVQEDICEAKSTENPAVEIPQIQAALKPDVFSNAHLDFFVPPGQPQAAIVRVIAAHLERLKNITGTLLPVRYPDAFYNECLKDDAVADFSRVLLWNSQPVGWIRCRLEDNEQGLRQIYIQALGILAPYRGCGLATSLLDQATKPALLNKYNPTSVYCHVWERNKDALQWYENRGFDRVILIEQYYRRLKPSAAWLMRKELP